MRGHQTGARNDGVRQCRINGALCTHAEAGRARGRATRSIWITARRAGFALDHDVRSAVKRHSCRRILVLFRWLSIGSNDLTQLTLGLDRDSGMPLLAQDFDERDPAVRFMLQRAIDECLRQNKYIGICGQGPSDHPDFAAWLMQTGITSISLNPDTVIETWRKLAAHSTPV